MITKYDKVMNKYFRFRPAIIYAYSCLDYSSNARIKWAYIGQTRQELIIRHNQHMGAGYKGKAGVAQPWSDLYPEIRILREFKCPDFVLDLVEEYYIKFKRPVYNYIHNTKNSRRVTKYEAITQREYRDLDRKYLQRAARRGKM